MDLGFIYKITSPSGRKYIGQTKNITDRINRYKRLSCKNQKLLYNSLKKYGFESHEILVIEEVPMCEIMQREKFWIDSLKTNFYKNPELRGLNLCDGGVGPIGRVASEQSKLKNSIRHKGKIMSEESKRKISLAGIGRRHSEESKKKMSEIQKGKTIPKETRDKISLALKGRNEHCLKMRVAQIDLHSNKIIQVFESISQAAIYLGSRSYSANIVAVCKGRLNKTYGFKWQYK